MAFILINKVIVLVLIIALLINLFRRKRKADTVFVLSVITLFVWLINIVADGYFRINFVNLSLFEVGFLPAFELWSKYAVYVLLAVISAALLVRAVKRADEKKKLEEIQQEENS